MSAYVCFVSGPLHVNWPWDAAKGSSSSRWLKLDGADQAYTANIKGIRMRHLFVDLDEWNANHHNVSRSLQKNFFLIQRLLRWNEVNCYSNYLVTGSTCLLDGQEQGRRSPRLRQLLRNRRRDMRLSNRE
jgi:hypothetical protein